MTFDASHVHPIALTPSGARLMAVHTPDARLEALAITPDGGLVLPDGIPVWMEPVTVVGRADQQDGVVNILSDSIRIASEGAQRSRAGAGRVTPARTRAPRRC